MKITVKVDENRINQLLSYLIDNNFEWVDAENDEEELSDAHKAIIDERLEAIQKDPSRLRPIEDFFKEMDKTL